MYILQRIIPKPYRQALKAKVFEARRLLVRSLMSYDASQLLAKLRDIGVHDGDALMVHSAFAPHHGFRGSIEELTNTLLSAVGPSGHLAMVSMPYRTSGQQYLTQLKQFDVRRTPSMMGLVSEMFRRRPAVRRSLHPTHPILVHGPRADWIVGGHEDCRYPCGPGTPFDKLLQLDAKVLFFNVGFETFTFYHFLEHRVGADLPFPLYVEPPFEVPVVDAEGRSRTITTHVFSAEGIPRRRIELLEQALRRRHQFVEARVGNSRVVLVRLSDAVACVDEMRQAGQYFYDLSGLPAATRQ